MLHKLLKPARCCCRYRRDVSQLTEINAKLVLALEHYKAIERGDDSIAHKAIAMAQLYNSKREK